MLTFPLNLDRKSETPDPCIAAPNITVQCDTTELNVTTQHSILYSIAAPSSTTDINHIHATTHTQTLKTC